MARIAAARAVHGDLLARATGRPAPGTLPEPDVTASLVTVPASTSADGPLARALAHQLQGEHAAVFAYGIVVARAHHDLTDLARQDWDTHIHERDALDRALRALGITPPAAEPAYDIGAEPTSASETALLAARIEAGIAALITRTVGVSVGTSRMTAARALVATARRAAVWDPQTPALPGGDLPGGLIWVTPSPSPR